MKKICIISGVQLWPPESGGQLRTATLAETLAKGGDEVSVYSLTGRKKDYLARARSETYQRFPRVTEHVDRSLPNAALQLLSYRLGLPDFWHLLARPLPRELARLLDECDVAIADFPFLARYLKHARGALRVINSHNLEHERWRGLLASAVRGVESRAVRKADVFLVTSDREAAFYRERGGKSAVVPNGISPDRFRFSPDTRRKARAELGLGDSTRAILFAASRYEPNRLAFDFLSKFAERNSAFLAEQRLVFLVVGSVTPAPVRRAGLVATGPVDRTEKYFSAADWAINPVTTGSGTNLKMAEYLAARLPILSTAFGTRGFALRDGIDCVVFEPGRLREALTSLPEGPMADAAYEANLRFIDASAIVREVVRPILSPRVRMPV